MELNQTNPPLVQQEPLYRTIIVKNTGRTFKRWVYDKDENDIKLLDVYASDDLFKKICEHVNHHSHMISAPSFDSKYFPKFIDFCEKNNFRLLETSTVDNQIWIQYERV